MASGRDAVARRVAHLYGEGTVAGLTERQLLERFIARRDEVAFEALVSRHGPMVLGVCRRTLRDPRDVEDAFQATFLVLVRRAGAIRDRELLAPWLHRVARRVALRAGIEAARRRLREGPGAEGLAEASTSPARADFAGDLRPAIDEELGRLPEKYRNPVVLCYLEGRTHEEAALQLRWPVGTVKGRLSRARDLLRGRLARRGLAPTAGLLAMTLADDAKAAVPEALTTSTIQAATRVAAGGGLVAGTVPAAIASLAEGVARTMLMNKLRAMAVGLLAFGAVAAGAEALARQFGGGAGFGGGAAVKKSDPGQAGTPGAGTGAVIAPGGDGPGAARADADAPNSIAMTGSDGGAPAGMGEGQEAAEAAAVELDEARVDAELLEIEVEGLKAKLQELAQTMMTTASQPGLIDRNSVGSLDEWSKRLTERKKQYEGMRSDFRTKSLELGRTKRLVNRLQNRVNAATVQNMGGAGRMMGMMGGMQRMGAGMAPMMGGMPGAMPGRPANARTKSNRPGPAAKTKGRANRPGPASAKPAAGARPEDDPAPEVDPDATKASVTDREDDPDPAPEAGEMPAAGESPDAEDKPEAPKTPEARETTEGPERPEAPETPEAQEKPEDKESAEAPETKEAPEAEDRPESRERPEDPRKDDEAHHSVAPVLQNDQAAEDAASELDEANTTVELLDLELQSLWQQLHLRLHSLKMMEEGDVENVDSPAPSEDAAKKARERYEELRKTYQEKTVELGRAKRQVRRLMSLLNEDVEPQRRSPNPGMGMMMGGMGGGMGGMGGRTISNGQPQGNPPPARP